MSKVDKTSIDIVNTIICYDNSTEVIQYARKLYALTDSENVGLIIHVNKLPQESFASFKEELSGISHNIFIYGNGTNLGYINGMINGYAEYIETHNRPNYIIMSNTDIEYPDQELIVRLRNQNYEDSVWCIGPSIYVPSRKSYDNPVCDTRRSKESIELLIRRLKTPILNEIYINAAHLKARLIRRKESASREVYEVHGCYFIIKPELAQELMHHPFGALLYSEEAYIAETVFKNKHVEYYDNGLIVNHMEHSVTGRLRNKAIAKHISESMEVILHDYYEE